MRLRVRSLMATLFVLTVWLSPSPFPAVPDLISYQGQLLDAAKEPVTLPTTVRFRLFRGGDDLTFPSTGQMVYDEIKDIAPDGDGRFTHMIGSGSPGDGCPEGICALSDTDFGDGSVPVWIELTVDTDGVAGTFDDEVVLPRTRIGTAGYAYRVSSLDGARLGDEKAIAIGPFSNPVENTYIRIQATNSGPVFADGNEDGIVDEDHVYMVGYNVGEGSSGCEIRTEYCMKDQWEFTYAPIDGTRAVEHNWDFLYPGERQFRPFFFYLNTDHAGGYSEPWAKWRFMTDKDTVAFQINQNGNVAVGGGAQPTANLEVQGRGTLHLAGSSGGRIIFEGKSNDRNDISLMLRGDPTLKADLFIPLPAQPANILVSAPNDGLSGVVMWGDGNDPRTDTGTKVCERQGLVCDRTRGTFDFGDPIRESCETSHGAAGHTSGSHIFMALCRM